MFLRICLYSIYSFLVIVILVYQVKLNENRNAAPAEIKQVYLFFRYFMLFLLLFISSNRSFMVLVFVSSPQNLNSVISYSLSCRPKPVRPSFIFRIQIKIFLVKSASFLTLHSQQRNWHVQGSEIRCWNGLCDINGSTIILWSYENSTEKEKATRKQK